MTALNAFSHTMDAAYAETRELVEHILQVSLPPHVEWLVRLGAQLRRHNIVVNKGPELEGCLPLRPNSDEHIVEGDELQDSPK